MSDWLCSRKVIIFAAAQKSAGKCEQCQYPWNDGLCSCGKWGTEEELVAKEYYADYRAAEAANERAAASAKRVAEAEKDFLSVDELSKLWERK